MSSRVIFAAVAAELSICVVAMSGCASGGSKGFGGAPSHSTHTTAATPAGSYAASASVTKQYGITEWRSYFGPNEIVLTGYRADGTAARGVQFAWFPPAQGSVGHTRLSMLDGLGSVLRRMVGGGEAGHLSSEQIAFIQTMRSDVAMGRKPAIHKLRGSSGRHLDVHLLDAPSFGNAPGQGPKCFEASTDPSTVIDASGCIVGAVTFETVVGGVMAMASCGQWAVDNMKTSTTCDAENSQYCNNDDPPTCNYGGDTNTPPPAPQQQCDQACICANYGTYNGMPCSQTCTDNATCGSGQECHWGSCGPAAAPADSPTNQNVSQQNPGSSCSSGTVTTDPSTGQVSCSNGSDPGTSGGSSGGGSSSSSSSGTDTTGGDPTGGSGSSGSSSSSSGGGQCADDGAGCSQDSDCCLGACGSGTCGVSGDSSSSSSGGSSGSSSGGGCAADGDACSQDSDCCAGSCDTTSGTCGSGSGSSSGGSSGSSSGGSCAADGAGCAQDSDCCGGSCDSASGTCGSGGSSSSGSSSGGGCAADGNSCAQASDCCSGACTSGTCGSGTTCGNPGDGCAQDSDCCSGSCDTSTGACN